GEIVVAAAGNSGQNADTSPLYPAAFSTRYPNVISVAATDSSGNLAGFSTYGPQSVTLGAPGANIYSTLPGGGYGYKSGTSMAAPHVAGAVALVAAANPTWTASQIINQIKNSVTPLPSLSGKTVTGGLLNVGAAVPLVGPAVRVTDGSTRVANGSTDS